ncbi:MAG: hypothetical protein SFV52_01280 [Saprospiraceae bacterium]|nr:hypothetical protein [Saprospiraceae bacterium]
MVKYLLRIGLVLVVAILVYNYFFGTSAEKAQSRKIFGEVKTLVGSVAGVLEAEKGKFDAGKYDGVLDKLGGAFGSLHNHADKLDPAMIRELEQLEIRKKALEQELGEIRNADAELARMSTTPPPSGKRGLAKNNTQAEQAKTQKAADQTRRKEDLEQELERLIQDTDRLLQKAIE